MMIGALVLGPLADRIGRKPVLVSSTLVFGVGSLLTATAALPSSLILFRLLTGFGLGGAMPNTIALTSEQTPKRFRATAITTMFCGFSIGAATGGFVAASLITRFGWQSVFVVGGIAPCAIALMSMAVLPESRYFLVEKPIPGAPVVSQLFAAGRARVTLLIWVMFFMNLLNLYFLNAWLPTVIHDAGIQVQTAIIITSLFQLGGTAGALILGRLIDRYLSFQILAWTYLAAAVSILLIGEAGTSIVMLIATVSAAGFCVIGGQNSVNALTSEFYPTAIRSTGVGWAFGIGRIGSIVGPLLGGVLLSFGGATSRVFWAAAVPALIATLAAFATASFRRKEHEK
jgi:AAHS family 4-hydroxybenzoate transporter-like MFS transporter